MSTFFLSIRQASRANRTMSRITKDITTRAIGHLYIMSVTPYYTRFVTEYMDLFEL